MPLALLGFFGFFELYPDPALIAGPDPQTVLAIANPHAATSAVSVDGHPVGAVAPRRCAVITGLAAGPHTLSFATPEGYVRTVEAIALTQPTPASELTEPTGRFQARSSPLCAR